MPTIATPLHLRPPKASGLRAYRDHIVDGPASLGAQLRRRRWELLEATFPELDQMSVLDLGGTAGSWLRSPTQPRSVTLLNLTGFELTVGQHEGEPLPDWISVVAGDACDPPASIRDTPFDLVFSNSLIEHVGGPSQRRRLAEFVRTAPRFWVQTPYRYFPVEPHWIFPGFQFLPLAAKAQLSRVWPLMHTRSGSWAEAVSTALDVELVSITELQHLFPEATVVKERFGGLVKSITAVRA